MATVTIKGSLYTPLGLSYSGHSLDSLAAMFNDIGQRSLARSRKAPTLRERAVLDAEARTWREAANMLRLTKLEVEVDVEADREGR